MAKGNPFWAKQTGKLGETVLAVVKGEQVQRAYNPEPVNPRSKGQTGQRIIFSSAVKLFKSAIAKQFKFAYEDKKQKESDYNAFMRHNIKNGMIITRDQYLNPNFPSIGEYTLSVGQIPEIMPQDAQGIDEANFYFKITLEEEPTTLQELANAFKESGYVANGDIITLLHIKTGATGINSKPTTPPSWNIVQIKVGDATDTRTIASVQNIVGVNGDVEYLQIAMSENNAEGCAVIVSRPSTGGLVVSNSRTWYNSTAKAILTASQDPAYKKEALASWGMETQAVLQGSLLPNS